MPTTYIDTTNDKDETVKIVTKEYTIPESVAVETINMGEQIDIMTEAKGDIEKILIRFNGAREKYNEALTGLKSKTALLAEAACNFPELPKKIINNEE